jgi:hypothetical protein
VRQQRTLHGNRVYPVVIEKAPQPLKAVQHVMLGAWTRRNVARG